MADSPDDGGLFEDAIHRAQAEFSLSLAAMHHVGDLSERERGLVDVALAAGVVGTLAVLRSNEGWQDDDDRG